MGSALDGEKAAILRLIEEETAAFWNKDLAAWARCWVQEPYVRRWGWWAARGGMTVRDGWDQQIERMRALMAANPERNRSVALVRRERLVVRIAGEMAWATFDQHAPATGDGMDVAGLTHEMRILEKQGGAWKIAGLFFLQRSLDHIETAIVRVDERARVLWFNPAAEAELASSEAIEIRGGRLRALDQSANQRLQAAIRWAARLDDGFYPVRAGLPVVLDGGHGAPANVCWIIGESGLVLVAINDRRITAERLGAAALVYGITPAQMRVAKLIIDGHDMVTAAKRLGVSVNTARTHLQRMYDRTGVRTQPALVRALLSVSRPIG
jgi:DNA-binding CsgD family transcriptional regulator